jgi:GDPmannose 4,6-dehydratase
MKRALITGITGQDGSYLAEYLLEKGYTVHGIVRRSSSPNDRRIDHLNKNSKLSKNFFLHYGDLSDEASIDRILDRTQPDEIYNLAAQSHVLISFETPIYTGDIGGLGVTRILDAVYRSGAKAKFYQASSSEMFGKVAEVPQTENTPFYPRSPYGVAKLYGYWITVNYRESYNLFACNGILFNHESPRRGDAFVTRKITKALSRIKLGFDEVLKLGNLESKRDWGFAKDYVEAMWMMMQHAKPDDYVVATGETHSVREFAEKAALYLGMDLKWKGKGLKEIGVDKRTGKIIIAIDDRFFRPAEVDLLIGKPDKIRRTLGWKPKTTFEDLVKIMVDADLETESRLHNQTGIVSVH